MTAVESLTGAVTDRPRYLRPIAIDNDRQRDVWMIVCVCVSRDGRAGGGGVRSSI